MSYSFKHFKEVKGELIDLLRLEEKLIPELAQNLNSPNTFFSQKRGLNSIEKISENLNKALDYQNKEERLTVVVFDKKTDKLAAMSSYLFPGKDFSKIEIGFTWIGDAWQRTHVNREMKLLMMTYAFEVMKVKRVEFSVDTSNDQSNTAMKKLGATFEGTLRKWRFNSPEDLGHRNIYSVIDDEWPEFKANLINKIKRH